MVNAIYFKGAWSKKFDIKKTVDNAQFTMFNGSTTECSMMNMTDHMMYASTKNLEMVKLDYGTDGEFSAFVVLPALAGLGHMKDAVGDLFGSDISWDALVASMHPTKMALSLPRFNVDSGVNSLKDSLKKMGASAVFEPSGLAGLTSNMTDYIDDVVHKAIIEVDEEGTVGAAVAAVAATRSISFVRPFKADRPFIFLVFHAKTKTFLFATRVSSV
ncbi:Serpin domain-containing protein [Baffinella frigidus]|nr:Serpin domain-containing protein [Cryptophyta sp. CCMP2293]